MTALTDFVCNSTWALSPTVLDSMVRLVMRHAEGHRATQDDIDAIVAARQSRTERELPSAYQNRDGVGVVPISGVIARHARQVNGMSSPRGTSIEQIRADLQAALADESAHSIMLAIDSPGGSVDGIVDVANELRAAREQKPMVAHVAGMAASAGYWLASQAQHIYATEGSQVGSIGVYTPVVDDHRRLENAGVDVRYVASTEGKVGNAPGKAVGKRDLDKAQSEVNAWHARFIDHVAAGRGVQREKAEAWGDAAMHFAADALSKGLIDGVASESDVIAKLKANAGQHSATRRASLVAQSSGRGTMNAQNEGAPQAVAPPVPTSAQDLRGAYPEAVQAIEREAVDAERLRVATIAGACNDQPIEVVRVGLAAIANGSSSADALASMLRAFPKAAAPASSTAQNLPTIESVRLATASNTPLGVVAAAPAQKVTRKQVEEEWASMGEQQRAEFYGSFVAYGISRGVIDGAPRKGGVN